MGEFYGRNLFLAAERANHGASGQLGGRRQHQEGAGQAARARGRIASSCANGTSTSNKEWPSGAARAGRHRDRRSQLPQIAPST